MKTCMVLFVAAWMISGIAWAAPEYRGELIFDPDKAVHGHVHASCVVECPDGGLLVVWYENAGNMPEPYFSAESDKSDDVRIGASRLAKGASAWSAPFVIADTFGCSDNNPCMVIDAEKRLWLCYPTLVAVPQKAWQSAFVQYRISSDYEGAGAPIWEKSGVLIPRPQGFQEIVAGLTEEEAAKAGFDAEDLARMQKEVEDVFSLRLGWMPRNHPLIRSDGALVLPLANENFDIPAMAITKDAGDTWTISAPVPAVGLTQPTLVEFPDGMMTAFFRNGAPEQRIERSESTDGGMTWSVPVMTDLKHPNAGIEAILLDNGHLAIVYNDKEDIPGEPDRDSLAISISTDRGQTWEWTRHLEYIRGGRFDYPSIIQAEDGTLHVTYSWYTSTIKHAQFNEEWVQEGD